MKKNSTCLLTRFPGNNSTAAFANFSPYRFPNNFLISESSGISPHLADAYIRLEIAIFISFGQSLILRSVRSSKNVFNKITLAIIKKICRAVGRNFTCAFEYRRTVIE